MWVPANRKEKQSAGRHGDKFWEDEKNSFGSKMMSKMGWKQGKGLGKTETGINSYLQTKMKNDNLGIGATVTQSDEQYTASQSIYNDLLSRLTVVTGDDPQPVEQPKSTTTTAALIKQKMESRRLYSRFAKAKDVSNYSEEQMKAILGKSSKDDKLPELKPTVEEGDNIITVTATVSMDDYFSSKLNAITAKYARPADSSSSSSSNTSTGFTVSDQGALYDQILAHSHSGRGGLGFGGGSSNNPVQVLNKLNPAKRTIDVKKWGEGGGSNIAQVGEVDKHVDDIPPPNPKRAALSVWGDSDDEEKKRKAKKAKKEKSVKIEKLFKYIIRTLEKTEEGLHVNDIYEYVRKKVGDEVSQQHVLDALLHEKFEYNCMLCKKPTSSSKDGEDSIKSCAISKIADKILQKSKEEWVELDTLVKKVTKKHDSKVTPQEVLSRACQLKHVKLHVYTKE